jgi:sulfane dehydrogenase subunit SoxC
VAADSPYAFPEVGNGGAPDADPRIYEAELHLALRNHALPLEALRDDVTPAGLHYTLTHYDIPEATPGWELTIDGAVRKPLKLSLRALKRRAATTRLVTLQCAGDGRALMSPRPISQPWLWGAVGTAEWTGTPLAGLLEEAGLDDSVVDLVFTGADSGIEGGIAQSYQRALSRQEATRPDVLVAWKMNGQPLPAEHGAPLRLVAPGWFGMAHVKWLRRVTAVTAPFGGYQNTTAYRYTADRADPGHPVTFMLVRSLMIPPGVPDFLTRTRVVPPGTLDLRGRAWSGRSPVVRVEVTSDGGVTWADAELDSAPAPNAWQAWRYRLQASQPGTLELACRAHDAAGNSQPLAQAWNARGMANNMVQRVLVQVRSG